MKKALSFAPVAVMSAFMCTIVFGAQSTNVLNKPAPTGEEIVHAILLNQNVSLDVHVSCPGAWSQLKGHTIGDYFSAVMAASITNDFKGMKLKISAVPEVWPATKELGWKSEVLWFIDDKQSPWSRGITFFMRAKDRSVIKSSFMCPGTP